MAVTNVTGLPQVYKPGGAVEERYAYPANEVIAPGDLIRITAAETIKLAEINTDSIASGIHGIALDTGGVGDTDALPVLLFADDTVISMPCADDTNPDDYTTDGLYEMDASSATGVWALADDTNAGIFSVVTSAKTYMPWNDVTGSFAPVDGTDNNGARVLCTIPASILQGVKGA